MTAPHDASLERFEARLPAVSDEGYEMTLFVSGASDLSARAIANAKRLCEIHLPGRYRLSVVDVQQEPAALVGSAVLAVPSLVRNAPLPVRVLVGDLSRTAKVLEALGLPPAGDVSTVIGEEASWRDRC